MGDETEDKFKMTNSPSIDQSRAEGNNTECVGKKRFNGRVLPMGFGKSMCYVPFFGQGQFFAGHAPYTTQTRTDQGHISFRDLSVPLPSENDAQIAYRTLGVDAEPKRGGVKRTISVEGNHLNVHFEAAEARMIRVSVNNFFDHFNLVIQTIEQFGTKS